MLYETGGRTYIFYLVKCLTRVRTAVRSSGRWECRAKISASVHEYHIKYLANHHFLTNQPFCGPLPTPITRFYQNSANVATRGYPYSKVRRG